jgi:ABC-type glycerol-3-phosphate transport system substrate-binding protein
MAQATWVAGKSAMTVTAGTDVRKFVDQVGADKVGVMAMPAYGMESGRQARLPSQTLGITSWSQHMPEAADFIRFLHTPRD